MDRASTNFGPHPFAALITRAVNPNAQLDLQTVPMLGAHPSLISILPFVYFLGPRVAIGTVQHVHQLRGEPVCSTEQ